MTILQTHVQNKIILTTCGTDMRNGALSLLRYFRVIVSYHAYKEQREMI
jgi:hypothetical protein